MFGIRVELVAETACFRDPGGQLYHVTLPLPPVSTIVGLAGAALGLSFEQTWTWFRQAQARVGVKGASIGKGKDLWNYTKWTVDLEKKPRNDILNREFLCFAPRSLEQRELAGMIQLYYACEDESYAGRLYEAFLSPVYALTLGASDDLAKCISVKWFDHLPVKETTELSNVMIKGDWSHAFTFDWEAIQRMPLRISLNAPKVARLPIDFVFDAKGVRKGARYESFTFLTHLQRLKQSVEAYCFGEEFVPLAHIH
ncbi:CRISPR-associated protein Cas5 [Aneurinibacillus thermoaerophilus]|uniref:CRISPR-associated protein Cas5 n=1 Tax=Aneurinibacillus thermoaerophilus TaxID=143495 RepID=UPI002E1B2C38|nr:CRISPR-associated protein Cas5 [Aneurinibacillus thermoaerophilus]MED0680466.1 CRISPR-associated protein Cas5 [Aneurinibacillus thermoaerophilus]MED0766084.1 CRISPR-associated protein Cas5 [Aneurinibacillus thermoaerophilus]